MKRFALALGMSILALQAQAGVGSQEDQELIASYTPKSAYEKRAIQYTLEQMRKPRLAERIQIVSQPKPALPFTTFSSHKDVLYGLDAPVMETETVVTVVKEKPARYVIVNIPTYSAFIVENEQVVMSSKVIVGKGDSHSTKTPTMTTNITHAVWNPYWAPPFQYSREETIAGWRKNPRYLQDNRLSVIINASHSFVPEEELTEEIFRSPEHTIVQTPGDDNMLGKALFILDNKYDVYMHDTNNRNLFENSRRNFSLGCIRIQEWLHLAAWALNKPIDRILAEIGTGEMTFQPLPDKIPVFVVYWPVDVEDGKVVVYRDLYNWVK